MLVDLNRRIFKITAFFCVVVSVFSDGRMGFYRGGQVTFRGRMRCCVRLLLAWFVRYGLPFRLPVVAGVFSPSVGTAFFFRRGAAGVVVVCGIRRGGGLRFCGANAGMLWGYAAVAWWLPLQDFR